jgi:hypothetical protein
VSALVANVRDLIWVDETPWEDADAHWWMLELGGTWRHLIYRRRTRRVLGHGETQLDLARRDAVFQTLDETGFFELAPQYPPPGVPVEGDIVVVVAQAGRRSHRVAARPPEFLPGPLARLIDRLRDAGTGVAAGPPAPGYWRAERLDAARAERVRRRALLPHRQLDEEAPSPPSLSQAIADPGIWVAIGANELEPSREVAGERGEVVLEGPAASWLVELWHGN